MYKYKNKSGRISRTFHRFSRVLPALTVLFVLSAAGQKSLQSVFLLQTLHQAPRPKLLRTKILLTFHIIMHLIRLKHPVLTS